MSPPIVHPDDERKNTTTFEIKLRALLNEQCMEAGSNTPDWILAQFLTEQLRVFDKAIFYRDHWYHGKVCEPG